MIPRALVLNWRQKAPWAAEEQVEQDLILTRILIELFSNKKISKGLAFRGGTALNKLYFNPPARHSEDIDLVQIDHGPIGTILDEIRKTIDPWLGTPKRKVGHGRVTLVYKYKPITTLIDKMSIKIEINTREHFSIFNHQLVKLDMGNAWFNGEADLTTFSIEELLGTKFRALYQRKKGRDLFDLALAYKLIPTLNVTQVILAFQEYMKREDKKISKAEFQGNLLEKQQDRKFCEDIVPLLAKEYQIEYDFQRDFDIVFNNFVSLLPGEHSKLIKGVNSAYR